MYVFITIEDGNRETTLRFSNHVFRTTDGCSDNPLKDAIEALTDYYSQWLGREAE